MSLSLFFFVTALVCMLGVVGTLFYGLLARRQDVKDSIKSNKAMQWRIWLQAAAIILLILSTLSR